MTDKEFYSLRICPNCEHNNRQSLFDFLEEKGFCWECNNQSNFKRSEKSKQKLKGLAE